MTKTELLFKRLIWGFCFAALATVNAQAQTPRDIDLDNEAMYFDINDPKERNITPKQKKKKN